MQRFDGHGGLNEILAGDVTGTVSFAVGPAGTAAPARQAPAGGHVHGGVDPVGLGVLLADGALAAILITVMLRRPRPRPRRD